MIVNTGIYSKTLEPFLIDIEFYLLCWKYICHLQEIHYAFIYPKKLMIEIFGDESNFDYAVEIFKSIYQDKLGYSIPNIVIYISRGRKENKLNIQTSKTIRCECKAIKEINKDNALYDKVKDLGFTPKKNNKNRETQQKINFNSSQY